MRAGVDRFSCLCGALPRTWLSNKASVPWNVNKGCAAFLHRMPEGNSSVSGLSCSYSFKLFLNRVKASEAGQYSLMAQNKAGWNNLTFTITLRCE